MGGGGLNNFFLLNLVFTIKIQIIPVYHLVSRYCNFNIPVTIPEYRRYYYVCAARRLINVIITTGARETASNITVGVRRRRRQVYARRDNNRHRGAAEVAFVGKEPTRLKRIKPEPFV